AKKNSKGLKSTPPLLFKKYCSYFEFKIDIKEFIVELRKLMNKTINDFVCELGWSNEKYYSKIVNGYLDRKTSERIYSNPTVNYIFGGINHAINYYNDWKLQKENIKKLIFQYFLISF
ncbi:MAG: hypothetical protein K2O19_02745, partial [Malacoplasma sp.]|nr:hypothetical protein [Malacoplasma sp.]